MTSHNGKSNAPIPRPTSSDSKLENSGKNKLNSGVSIFAGSGDPVPNAASG